LDAERDIVEDELGNVVGVDLGLRVDVAQAGRREHRRIGVAEGDAAELKRSLQRLTRLRVWGERDGGREVEDLEYPSEGHHAPGELEADGAVTLDRDREDAHIKEEERQGPDGER